uniref:Uncharacterized protein n=1 Tax=Pithovirus LCPAC404 TaxID=2506597 RepID=A0A481ZET1_9VIRU|nr:MAG: hypothetical protein LCPAC404_01830 [Pithovirus LCPAC404]
MSYPVPKYNKTRRTTKDTRNEANIPWNPSFDEQSKESSFEMGSDWMNAAGILSTTVGNRGPFSKIISGGIAVGLYKSGITGLAAGFSCVPVLNIVSAVSMIASLFQDEDNANEQIMEMIQHNTQILSEQIGETYIQLRNQGIYILNQLDSVKLEMLNEFFKASEQRWNLKEDLLEMQRDVQMRLENTTCLTLMVYGSVNERLNQTEQQFYSGIDDRVSSTLNEALLACQEDISLDAYQDLFRKVATIATLTSMTSPMTGSGITLSENERVISALTSGRGRTLYGTNMNLLQQMYEKITESKIEQVPNLELLSACVHTLASLMDNQFRSEERPSERTLTSEWNCIEDIAELTCRVVNLIFGFKDVLPQLLEKYERANDKFKLAFRERKKNFKNELRDNHIAIVRRRLRDEYNLFSSHTINLAKTRPGMVKNPQYLVELNAIKSLVAQGDNMYPNKYFYIPPDYKDYSNPEFSATPHHMNTQRPLLVDLGCEKLLTSGDPYHVYTHVYTAVYVRIGGSRFGTNIPECADTIMAWYYNYNVLRASDVIGIVSTNYSVRVNVWNNWRKSHGKVIQERMENLQDSVDVAIEEKINTFIPPMSTSVSYLVHPDRDDVSCIFPIDSIPFLMNQPDLEIAYQAEFLGLGEVINKYTWDNLSFTVNIYFKMIDDNTLQIGRKSLPFTFKPPGYYALNEKIWHCVTRQFNKFSIAAVVDQGCQQFRDNMNHIETLVERKEKEFENFLRNEMVPNSEVYLKRKELDAHYYRLKALSQFMFDRDLAFNIGSSSDILEERKEDYSECIDMNIRNPLINNIVLTLSRLQRDYGDRDLSHQHIDNLLGRLWHPSV